MKPVSKLSVILLAAAVCVGVAAAPRPTRVTANAYTSVTLPDGGSYVFEVVAPRYATPGGWKRTTEGRLPRMDKNEWVQIMVDGNEGWRHTFLKIGGDGKPLPTRHNDRNFRLDSPWRQNNGTYRSGWYRVWPSAAPGHPYAASNEMATLALLTVRTNRSTIVFKGRNSPAEGLELHGNGNHVTVDLVGGPKAGLQTDRAELRVFGNDNRLTGTVKTEMVAVRVNGNGNELYDMVLEGLEVGNDVGVVVFPGRGFDGNKATNVLAVCRVRRYPVTWVHTGFYLDDRASRNTIVASRAKGFQSGAFVHGGSDNAIDLTAEYCEVPVIMGPHFTTPNDVPRNPRPTVRSFGTVSADRRVPRLARAGG